MDADAKVADFVDDVLAFGAGSAVFGLYLVGSHALGDVRPGSDIDFIGVLGRPPSAAELSALVATHERFRRSWPTPHLDGDWVLAADLRRPAEDVVPVLKLLSGAPVDAGPGALSPIEWLQLKQRGVRLLGPSVEELDVHIDMEHVRAYCRRNLIEYWSPQVTRLGELAAVEELAPWIADRVTWVALGIPRLLASIASGVVLSKTDAGHYALERLPEWRELLEASLEQRRDPSPERVPALVVLAPAAVEFGRRCIEIALSDR